MVGGDPINPNYDRVVPKKVPSTLPEHLLRRTFRPTESQHSHPSQETSRRLVLLNLDLPDEAHCVQVGLFGLSRRRIGTVWTFQRRRISGHLIGNFSRAAASSIMPRMFSRLYEMSACVGLEEKNGTGREIQTGST